MNEISLKPARFELAVLIQDSSLLFIFGFIKHDQCIHSDKDDNDICIYIYIYMYIGREREREREVYIS